MLAFCIGESGADELGHRGKDIEMRGELPAIARRNRERPGVSDPFAQLAKVELKAALAEAIKGNATAAITMGERASAMMPLSRDAIEAPLMLQQLAGVYVLAGQHGSIHWGPVTDIFGRSAGAPLLKSGISAFFEINPAGEYQWVQAETGLPITEAICDLLVALAEGSAP